VIEMASPAPVCAALSTSRAPTPSFTMVACTPASAALIASRTPRRLLFSELISIAAAGPVPTCTVSVPVPNGLSASANGSLASDWAVASRFTWML
jgi:hypothetical protein